MQKDIAAKTIRRRSGKPDTTVIVQNLERKPREHKPSLAETVAGHPVFINNWYWPGGTNKFPMQSQLRKVDVYFPYAKDSKGTTRALCIDFCETEEDVVAIQPKVKELKKLGIKHLILRPRMTFNEAMTALGDD
jgi:hypothetical protein